ncbi:hypothetical protein AK812_SmicGene37672 [Symbiodinium microadriaticum]|uniref:Uncharacterized protein n=1 Tax=Symbiodinium microadriaticum TaxID=2951 RepID=A0A1Q9CFS3_SYMMI|nr:hypothetical protein AK812_SmicGene37672 [Symbiodinium microadriaticum]
MVNCCPNSEGQGPRVPGDELSTQLGKEVESKFGFIFRQLGLLVQANKTMLRTNGCWKFAPEYEVFCEQRRIIAAALREYPEAPEQLLGQHAADIDDALGVGGQFRETLLESARRARSMNQDAARAVQTCRPPVPLGSVLLEIDLVIGPTRQVHEDSSGLDIPVPVMTLTGQQIPTEESWSTIARNCQSGAFVEVSSQSWEQHGKLRSQSLLWLHEARQQVFPQGRTMYFYDGSMQHFGAVDGLHCYWFQKSCLLQVEQSLLEEQLRQVNAEKNALMAHSSVDVSTTSTSVVWVRELIRKDCSGTVAEDLEEPAFQLKGKDLDLGNVDDLKEAIKTKGELKGFARKIRIYTREGDSWKPLIEMEDAPLTRGSSKHDCYGYLPPA